jgi:hypothetical protein
LALGHTISAFDTREYAFKHHLLHQATYDTVLKRHKKQQHHQTAPYYAAPGAAANTSADCRALRRAGKRIRNGIGRSPLALARHADAAAMACRAGAGA